MTNIDGGAYIQEPAERVFVHNVLEGYQVWMVIPSTENRVVGSRLPQHGVSPSWIRHAHHARQLAWAESMVLGR